MQSYIFFFTLLVFFQKNAGLETGRNCKTANKALFFSLKPKDKIENVNVFRQRQYKRARLKS